VWLFFAPDLLIVNHFRGAGEAGVYAVASQVSFLLMMLPGVIGMLLFPRVASAQDPRGEFAIRLPARIIRHVDYVRSCRHRRICVAIGLRPRVSPTRSIQFNNFYCPAFISSVLNQCLVQHFTRNWFARSRFHLLADHRWR